MYFINMISSLCRLVCCFLGLLLHDAPVVCMTPCCSCCIKHGYVYVFVYVRVCVYVDVNVDAEADVGVDVDVLTSYASGSGATPQANLS